MTTKRTAVTTLPVTLAEAKLHLRIESDVTDEDALITEWIEVATECAEQECNRAFASGTYVLKLDAFPAGEIRLDWAPVASITSVQYIDTAEATQTLSASLYSLDAHNDPAWLLPAYGTEWPDTLDTANAVTVTYVAGQGVSSPSSVKSYIKLHLTHLYENRGLTTDKQRTVLPFAAGLLDRWRVY